MGKQVNAHVILFNRQNLGGFWRQERLEMTDSASEVGDRASEAQRGLTQQVSAELEVEPRSAGSQPFLFPWGPATGLLCRGAAGRMDEVL